MSGAKNGPETPRQKMIGMMYLVLTAMLALNVSSGVLNGFTMVDNSLHTTIESSELRNKSMYADFQDMFDKNPDKVREWLEKANLVKKKSDDLYEYIEGFKVEIVKMTDNKDANDSAYVKQILAKDNMDKPSEYAITRGNGKILKQKIEDYCKFLVDLSTTNPAKQKMYQSIFATGKAKDGKPWEIAMFEMMPVSAVITILTKYQSDIRASEAEIVQYLKAQTDVMDFRVNKITALVVPDTRYLIRGAQYSAQIVLSAVDSTKTPEYFVGASSIQNGLYKVGCGKTGAFTYSGQIKLVGNDGVIRSYPFKSDYIVGEPSATVSNEDLNVVYRGIDNKFSISVPGVAAENVSIRVAGGTVQKVGQRYIIRANQDRDINIAVYAKIDGKELPMGGGSYRVKYLPDPKSYLRYTDGGGLTRLVQDAPLSKRLLKGDGVSLIASYGQDELIKANFSITSFTLLTVFGSVNVNGSRFNAKQLSDIDKLEGGDILTLKNIKAVGPDGKVRILGLIQIQI
ncbi:MAG: gliding motility protein GldM [Peptostreptococcaceae bacterium]|nr:gliding motility protein GldM [Peptostreptococcaceae bacterium]